jgi:enterochelin esterase-like enzyme
MSYGVYTPPNWDARTPLPLVVFLHGAGDDERVFDKRRVVPEILDEWIADRRLPPFIMAVPDGQRGFWTNWHDGSHRYEDWVMDDVIPQMYERYPIIEGRENLHLMGISMGGAGTLYIALHNRDQFASAAVWSAPIFDVDQTMDFLAGKVFRAAPAERMFGPPDRKTVERDIAYGQLRSADDLAGMELLIGAGTRDIPGILPSTRKFQAHLEKNSIPHRYVVYRGGHHWKDWARVFPVALCKHLARDECQLEDDSFYTLEERD